MPVDGANGVAAGGSLHVLLQAADARVAAQTGGSPESRSHSSVSAMAAAPPPMPPVDDDHADWRFFREGDVISPVDVPQSLRVAVPTDGPELFVFCPQGGAPEPTTRLDIWVTDDAHPDGPEDLMQLACVKKFMAAYQETSNSVTSRNIGDVWRALVDMMPWLAPVLLPKPASQRLRLLELVLRSVIVREVGVSEPLNPFEVDWVRVGDCGHGIVPGVTSAISEQFLAEIASAACAVAAEGQIGGFPAATARFGAGWLLGAAETARGGARARIFCAVGPPPA